MIENDTWPHFGFIPLGAIREDGTKINSVEFGICLPGTVKFGKPVQNPDGTWTFRFEYRAEGWADDSVDIDSTPGCPGK